MLFIIATKLLNTLPTAPIGFVCVTGTKAVSENLLQEMRRRIIAVSVELVTIIRLKNWTRLSVTVLS